MPLTERTFLIGLSISLISPIVEYLNIFSNFNIGDIILLVPAFVLVFNRNLQFGMFLLLPLFFSFFILLSLFINMLFESRVVVVDVFTIVRYLYYAFVVVAIYSFLYNTKRPDIILNCFLVGLIFTLLLCFVEWSNSPTYLGSIPMFHTVHNYSNFPINRNFLGFFSSLACVLSFTYLIFSKRRVASLLTFGLGLMFVVFSFSKGTWLAAAVPLLLITLIFVFGSLKSNNYVKIITVAFVITLIVATLPNIEEFFEKASTRVDTSTASTNERLQYIKDSINLIYKSPFFGVGIGNYEVATSGFVSVITKDPHNTLLWLWSETGIVPVLIFLTLIIILFNASHRIVDSHVCCAIFSLLVCLIIFIPTQGTPLTMKYLWFLYPLALYVIESGKESNAYAG